MPYPFAHPAAVLPLVRPMGRFAVPSALVIGSVAPDFWYLVPLVARAESHSLAGLLWFCLPAGVAAYALFHLLLKAPLIALVSPRLGAFACAGLPAAPWHAVIVSIVAGAATHLAWDLATHSEGHAGAGHNWPQHASTALGTLILAWWIGRKLRSAPADARPALSPLTRACTALALAGAMAIAALWAADAAPTGDLLVLRHLLRTAGVASLQGLSVALLVYGVLFQRKILPRAR